ncbi:MAG: hypothetical protein K2X82_28235 [Gemmataceae bacterium]|nr:hypothetical protein [Gemmataceae bacterium]
MIVRPAAAAVLLAGLALAGGCGPAPLDINKTAVVSPGNPALYELEAIPQPQTVTVEFDSDGGPVEVGIYRQADADEAETLRPEKALKFAKGEAKGSVSVEVPANTATKVAIGSEKKANVKVRLTNRK